MKSRQFIPIISLAVAFAIASPALARNKQDDKKPTEPKKEEPAKKPEAEPEKKPTTTSGNVRKKPVKDAQVEKLFGLAEANLTGEQREKLDPFLKEQAGKAQALRTGDKGERKPKLQELQAAVRAKLKETLTSEQFEKWDKSNGGQRKKKVK